MTTTCHAAATASLYWGGAVYFMQVDSGLRRKGIALLDVVDRCLHCCRQTDRSLDHVLTSMDRLTETRIFTKTYQRYVMQPGFPSVPAP